MLNNMSDFRQGGAFTIMRIGKIEQETTKQDVIDYWGKIVDESTLSVDVKGTA